LVAQIRTKKRHPKTKLPVFGREYVFGFGITVVKGSGALLAKQPIAIGH